MPFMKKILNLPSMYLHIAAMTASISRSNVLDILVKPSRRRGITAGSNKSHCKQWTHCHMISHTVYTVEGQKRYADETATVDMPLPNISE